MEAKELDLPGAPSPDVPRPQGAGSRHILTVAIEDYFHLGAFNRLIQRGQWSRFERRVEHGTRHTLELLDRHGARATFFVLGWIAEQMPELVREVADRGHEIASKGFYHRRISSLSPNEFAEDLDRAREAIEAAAGCRIHGFRVADGWFGPHDLWALDVLARSGFRYDSSLAPLGRQFAAEPWRRFAHEHLTSAGTIHEFPISTATPLGFAVPVGGGNYLRQLPEGLVDRALSRWTRQSAAPLVMYFHTWELDPAIPRISAAPWHQRLRTYRNLDRMADRLGRYLTRYQFTSIGDWLGLSSEPAAAPARPRAPSRGHLALVTEEAPATPPVAPRPLVPVTIAVPCYNEKVVLPYLATNLQAVRRRLEDRYELSFAFIDDGSSDGTWESLERIFGSWPRTTLVRHHVNRGLSAGIRTALETAGTEIVCTIDCDCSYNPLELEQMIPLLEDGVDLVTASPYHPRGSVRNVSPWRLALSRTASLTYRAVLGQPINTFTSCFRVYRRSRSLAVPQKYQGYLGISELLGRVALAGGQIREHPATLEIRLMGVSKMKVVRNTLGHLRLLGEFALLRLFRRGASTS